MLDPFVGSGTTIFTSLANDRNVVGIDMSPDYIDLLTLPLRQTVIKGLSLIKLSKESHSHHLYGVLGLVIKPILESLAIKNKGLP